MDKSRILLPVAAVLLAAATALGYRPDFPFFPAAAGQPGSTAIHMADGAFVAWADGYADLEHGTEVDDYWKTPQKALGPAAGGSYDIVCLGNGGRITLLFSQGIADGPGYDFAVFENAVSDTFLELAWVEVSSDGIHFVRFPNYSFTPDPVGSLGPVYPTLVHGFGGKYRQGYGTPFDLAELELVADSIQNGGGYLSAAYQDAFLANYPHLDRFNIRFVRLLDVVGDGTCRDAEGEIIYDPHPTTGSGGFDLDAVGVINQPPPAGTAQQILFDPVPHQKLAFGAAALQAAADSGLPVSFAVQSGPAVLEGNRAVFTGTGTVEVVASQPGDATYAPAAPVLRSFRVAEEIQHLFVEPLPNQLRGGGPVQVRAYASSGLPVEMQVFEGPPDVGIGAFSHLLDLGGQAGTVVLRAFQPGNAAVAPAEDLFAGFHIVESGAGAAPVPLATWLLSNPVPEPAIRPATDRYGRPAVDLEFVLDRRAAASSRVLASPDLASWTNAVPEILESRDEGDAVRMRVRRAAEAGRAFFRLEIEAQ